MPEALHLLNTAYDADDELIESLPVMAIVLCMKGGPELCKQLKAQLAPKIPLYFSVMQQEIPTSTDCFALLTQGTLPSHLAQEDPERRFFRGLAQVWAWAMNQIVRCIKESRGQDDDQSRHYPLYSIYNVRDDLLKFAPLLDTGRTMYKVVFIAEESNTRYHDVQSAQE